MNMTKLVNFFFPKYAKKQIQNESQLKRDELRALEGYAQ